MSASAGIAASSAAIAAQAAADAREAKVIACKSSVKGYQHEGSTVTEMVGYADCIRLLAPEAPLTGTETAVVKVCIVLLLIGMVAGGFWGKRALGESVIDIGMGSLMGAFFVAVVLFVAALLYFGVAFLFS